MWRISIHLRRGSWHQGAIQLRRRLLLLLLQRMLL
jgi:hypothetical protein